MQAEEDEEDEQLTGTCRLPNGNTLYWSDEQGLGRRYLSDEVGGGVIVWVTALVCESTLLAAMCKEKELQYKASWAKFEAERDAKEKAKMDAKENDLNG